MDLRNGDLIEPSLDQTPHRREAPRGVDDIELAHALRIEVLADRRRFADVVANLDKLTETDPFEVKDRARGLDRLPCNDRAGGGSFGQKPLVFVNESPQESVLGGNGVESLDINTANAFDVDWSSILESAVTRLEFDCGVSSGFSVATTCLAPCRFCDRIEDRFCRPPLSQGTRMY